MNRTKEQARKRLHMRIRNKISGTGERPRLSVYRSSKEIYCQLINDLDGHTIAAATSKGLKGTKSEQAAEVGKMIAERAKSAGVEGIVFDRGGYRYHGRVRSLAEGAREGGLKF
ncbi:MAG: 50S ribosomal protein L18 [Lewinellaceae bacterium]|nr:50S ribosomal protein L18 [Saprospiraceae bacterium]MCB9344570.1 50S ribosomal protein L18 [Lewinellaceae bacterium]